MKEPYPSQKYHVLVKLKMARSGQGWQRLKILLTLFSAKIRSRGSSRQTFGATELGSPIISTNRSLTSIVNMTPACQESGLTQGQRVPASSSLPLLVPSFASPSSSLPSPDPSWCFSFFLFFSSFFLFFFYFLLPPRKVLLSIWALLGQSLEEFRRRA